ncbi:GlsB/YeaQ/YmgE family stress response membrane protein [Prosthecobacter sp.]|uniref:GlsB/YeaQ/YmgE family stress response membrane protein n=1 Tax=Prosthecobacter sp. TaxID=1965333 RepID=UPI0037832F86
MTFLWTLLIGLIVGVIAKAVTPGKDPGGCLVTILLGIVGASVAGYLGRSAGWYTEGQPVGFLASVLGAVLVLLVYRMITGRRA